MSKKNTTEPIDPSDSFQAEDVLEALHTFMHSYHSCLLRALRESPYDLTIMDVRVLKHIARYPGSTQKDLVAHSGKDKGQLARLITGLRKRELIKVQVDDKDRRSLHLYLTEVGQNIYAELFQQRQEIHKQVTRLLSATERQTMLELIEKLRPGINF